MGKKLWYLFGVRKGVYLINELSFLDYPKFNRTDIFGDLIAVNIVGSLHSICGE